MISGQHAFASANPGWSLPFIILPQEDVIIPASPSKIFQTWFCAETKNSISATQTAILVRHGQREIVVIRYHHAGLIRAIHQSSEDDAVLSTECGEVIVYRLQDRIYIILPIRRRLIDDGLQGGAHDS